MSTSIAINNGPFEEDHPKYSPASKSVAVEGHGDSIFTKLKNIISISEILRLFGACAVIASMSLFLLNGWTEGNDIQRYLKLLAQTGLLTLAGFAMSYALKENKGARLFFALALISVVANFAILGALTYSMFPLDNGLIDYPSMVTWTVVSATSFWPVFIGAVIALMVLARFSFSIFARNIATPLSINFLAMNALLLIPVRSSLLVSAIAIVGLWVSSLLVKRLSANEKVVFTNETKFALSLMFAPALLIIARAVSLYSLDEVMLVLICGLAYAFLRFTVSKLNESPLSRSLVEIMQFCMGFVFALSVVSLLPRSVEIIHGLVFSLVAIGLTLDQMHRTTSAKWKQVVLSITTMIVVGVNLTLAAFEYDIFVQLISVLVCAALFYIANRYATADKPNKLSKNTAFIGVLLSVGILIIHFVDMIQLGNWMLIGLLGVSLIVLGSLYERFGLSLTTSKILPKS